MKNLLIIGASDAGISAALRSIEVDPNIKPTLIDSGNYPNFSICGLPYYISRDVDQWKDLAHRSKEEIESQGIRLLLEHSAESINKVSKTIDVVDTTGTRKTLEYDKLIICTGAVSVKPKIPGIHNPGIFFLRWIPDAFAINEFIEKQKPRSAVLIGAGFISMEMCEALTARGIKVTVVEFAESVMPSFDAEFGDKLKEILTHRGITVYNKRGVESIENNGKSLIINGTDSLKLQADMVLVAVGSAPNSELGRSIGINSGMKNAFKVNQRMETNLPAIYAAGDCVETWHTLLQNFTYLPLGTIAHKQGRIAGENAAGGNKEFAGSLGTQSVKIFDKVIARTGLNVKEAGDNGFNAVYADFETWDHKVYYPGAEKISIRVIADRNTKRILGAQVFGNYKTEISKRIDIFAAAIYHATTVHEFSNYDLSYTPPLSSPWDPVQMAVQKLEKIL